MSLFEAPSDRFASISRRHLTNPVWGIVHLLHVSGADTDYPDFDIIPLKGRKMPDLPSDPNLERAVNLVRGPLPLKGTVIRLGLPGGTARSKLHEPTREAFYDFMDMIGAPADRSGALWWHLSVFPDERSVTGEGAAFTLRFTPGEHWLLDDSGGSTRVPLGHVLAAGARLMTAATLDNHPFTS
jgi:hypothetical protein